jgi:Plasmid recombination enzyme.
MGFAVIHIEKGTAGKAGGLGNHIDRTKNVPNANPELEHYNARVDLERTGTQVVSWTKNKYSVNLQKRINDRIKKGYTGKTTIRKDAVTHLNIVMTGSHEDMKRISKEGKLREWADDNYRFACNRFGKENVVDFTVHMDERTPHIHCIVVPLTKDGRLSAKEIMGDRLKMTDLQEQYAKEMRKYDLQRGIKGSKATHDTVKEYYARINQRMIEVPYKYVNIELEGIPKIEKPPLIGRDKWIQKQNKAIYEGFDKVRLTLVKELNKKAENTLKIAQDEKLKAQEMVSRLRKENAQLRGLVKEQDKVINPQKYVKQQNKQDRNKGWGMTR